MPAVICDRSKSQREALQYGGESRYDARFRDGGTYKKTGEREW